MTESTTSVWKAYRPVGTPHPACLTLAGDDTVIVSGLSGMSPDGTMPETAYEQSVQAIKNIESLLQREGFTLDEVILLRPYVTDMAFAPDLAKAVLDAFGEAPPASGALLGNVTLAHPAMLMELEAIAVRGVVRELVAE
ncbi:Rid family hydrolase [Gordonia sp. NPDC003376]